MKYRWIWLFPAVYFPYHVLFAMRLLRRACASFLQRSREEGKRGNRNIKDVPRQCPRLIRKYSHMYGSG